jgi:uncharacterized protein (DUF924 family)
MLEKFLVHGASGGTMMEGMSISPAKSPAEAAAVVEFWKAAGPKAWFAKNDELDRRFRERFAALYERAARCELDSWMEDAESALALILLLDQYPRNSFRGTPRMYATDALGVHYAARAVERGYDRAVDEALQFFFYLPFGHAESSLEQERCVALHQRFGPEILDHAIGHRDIVRRFGRFPHRNPILGRPSSEAELEFLKQGGYAG